MCWFVYWLDVIKALTKCSLFLATIPFHFVSNASNRNKYRYSFWLGGNVADLRAFLHYHAVKFQFALEPLKPVSIRIRLLNHNGSENEQKQSRLRSWVITKFIDKWEWIFAIDHCLWSTVLQSWVKKYFRPKVSTILGKYRCHEISQALASRKEVLSI